jgi:hypothetical protein
MPDLHNVRHAPNSGHGLRSFPWIAQFPLPAMLVYAHVATTLATAWLAPRLAQIRERWTQWMTA